LIVTSSGPVTTGGQNPPMEPEIARQLAKVPGVEAALPVRFRRLPYKETRLQLVILNAGDFYRTDSKRAARVPGLELYRTLRDEPMTAIISENLAALHGVDVGSTLTLTSPQGPVHFRVIGKLTEYSWNHGSVRVNRDSYLAAFKDDLVDVFDVYVESGADAGAVRRAIESTQGLEVKTREELQRDIDSMIERLYGIAYGQ